MTAQLARLIFAAAALAFFLIRLPYQRRSHLIPVRASRDDRRESVLVALAGLGLGVVPGVYAAIGFPHFADHAFVPALAFIALTLFIVALALFYLAHRELGRQYSSKLKLREDHRLVTTGVYASMRHPMYTAFWLWAVAQALLLPNWIAGLSGLVGFGLLYFMRIEREEEMMLATFGDAYRAYSRDTARLIPGLY
jgi:protein-S-isoprenylcysteine O-methyltransferase Ste14